MPDEPASGAPGGGAAAPTSGGGSAPSAPAAPAAPSTPAPVVSSPAAAPSTPETTTVTGPPVKEPGESDDKFLARFHAYDDAQPKEPEAKPEVKPEPAKPAAEVKPEPAKPAEEVKPAAEVKPAIEEAKQPDELDTLGPLPASKLAELLTNNPDLDKALEDAGIKDDLFANAREAAAAIQYRKEFPDIETAKFAKGAAITLGKMDLAATELKPGDLGSTVKFVQDVLMPMSYILDDDGNPKMLEVKQRDGSIAKIPQTDGTVQTLLNNVRDIAIDQVFADAEALMGSQKPEHKEAGERLLAAVQEIQNFMKSSEETVSADLPENLKAEAAKIKAERDSLTNAKVQEADQRYTAFRNDTMEAVNKSLDDEIASYLKDSTLAPDPGDTPQAKASKDLLRDTVRQKIRDGLFDRFNRNELFLAEQEQKGRRGYSASTKAALVNHYVRSAQPIMEDVAKPLLEAAGYERVRQSKARALKIAAQQKVTQMEPVGATRPSLPVAKAIDEKAIMHEARVQLTAETRRDPQPSELIQRYRELVAKASQAA